MKVNTCAKPRTRKRGPVYQGEWTDFDPDAELTAAQAAEDVEYLFDAFRTLYGPYDYFGGDETFGEHKAELLALWTATEPEGRGLSFLKDHFNINE